MVKAQRGQGRAEIENVTPRIDDGAFPIKRFVGNAVVVEADAFTDGHDAITVVLLHRNESETAWRETPMQPLGNDRWRAAFTVSECGRCRYTVLAWVDQFKTWSRDFAKRAEAKQDLRVDSLIGVEWIELAAACATGEDAAQLQKYATALRGGGDEAVRAAASSSWPN